MGLTSLESVHLHSMRTYLCVYITADTKLNMSNNKNHHGSF